MTFEQKVQNIPNMTDEQIEQLLADEYKKTLNNIAKAQDLIRLLEHELVAVNNEIVSLQQKAQELGIPPSMIKEVDQCVAVRAKISDTLEEVNGTLQKSIMPLFDNES